MILIRLHTVVLLLGGTLAVLRIADSAGGAARPTTVNAGFGLVAQAVPPALSE
jgi:hypothetical protein